MRHLVLVGLFVSCSCGGSVDRPGEAPRDAGIDTADASNAPANVEASMPDEKPLDAAAVIDISTQPVDVRADIAPGGPVSDAQRDVVDSARSPLDASASPDVESEAPSCEPGAVACNGNQPLLCSALGTWQNSGGPCLVACIAGYCIGCLTGARQCNGTTVQACLNGVWTNESVCAFACVVGNCIGLCQPGSTRCGVDGFQVCDALATWQTVDGGCPSDATVDASDDGA